MSSQEKKSFYITTTLPYVNSDPHIGFALEIVQADAIARYHRQKGDEVFFSTGTDEHGQKIFESAQKAGQDVHEYVDLYAGEFKKLKEALDISNDTFVRTTDVHHIKAAQEMWRLCDQEGDIYKKSYEGKYCVGCEAFKPEKDLNENGECVLHPNLKIATLKEENYFFRFSKYQDKLIEYLTQSNVIIPDWRRDEALNFVKNGLEDFSISREKERLSWGVPVPDDSSQVMYVWFDALTNYISTLGWPDQGNFDKFWLRGEVVQTAGKDQVRFQSLMWQAMLMSAKIKNTDKVVYHGFITSGGQKMSKSLGNVINPLDLVKEYGADSIRYFLLRHVSPFEDSDVTIESIKEAYNANLANGLGNLASRILTMAENYKVSHTDSVVPVEDSDLDNFDTKKYMDKIWEKIQIADKKIQEKEPYKIYKIDHEIAMSIVSELCTDLSIIAKMLIPVMPETSKTILSYLKDGKGIKPTQPLFLRKD